MPTLIRNGPNDEVVDASDFGNEEELELLLQHPELLADEGNLSSWSLARSPCLRQERWTFCSSMAKGFPSLLKQK